MENLPKTSALNTTYAHPKLSDLSCFSDINILQMIKIIHGKVNAGKYSDKVRDLFSQIATELSKRNISPYERYYKLKFNPKACENNKLCSLYMIDLQVHELQWIHNRYKGHEVDDDARDGLYKGIFSSPEFDWVKARKIATASYEDDKGNIKNLTAEVKVDHLNLCLLDHMQEQLAILRSEKNRKRQEAKEAAHRNEDEEKKKFHLKAGNVRNQLDKFLKSYLPKNKFIHNVDECLSIWIAIQNTGCDITKHKDIACEYENITGAVIDISTLRRRITLLKKASIL